MKKLLVPTLCVLAGCAVGAVIPAVAAQLPDAARTRRWEHTCMRVRENHRAEDFYAAMHLGDQGYEMVGLSSNTAGHVEYCFKRPAP